MAEEKTFTVPHTIKLDEPFTYGNEEVTELVVNRRPKAKDFKGIHTSSMKFDDILRVGSRITGESISKIEELDVADMMKLVEVINSFLPSTEETGETA